MFYLNEDNIYKSNHNSQMTDLEKKLLLEANKESKVIACRFPLPNIKPTRIVGEGADTVWLYDFKSQT